MIFLRINQESLIKIYTIIKNRMAFTRFNDDPCRVSKQLQQSTDQGRWILNVPGNGAGTVRRVH